MSLSRMLTTTIWSITAGASIYVVAVALLTVPIIQRNAFYANKVNPSFFQNLSDVEQFGFLHHQVQPFTITSHDNTTIYAWHILPVHLYLEHEKALKAQGDFGLKSSERVLGTVGMQLLNDPNAHVVINFHGNAAHLGSSYRPATYQQMLGLSTPQKPVHVIAFDYRGFGLSTGQPTEERVIQDAITLSTFLTGETPEPETLEQTLNIPPSRILLLGQSLGTATSTALYHRWTVWHHLPPFRGLVLMASFSSVPSVLRCYSIKGLLPPLLTPVFSIPPLDKRITATVVDTWETDRRIAELIASPGTDLHLTILHANNDGDIPWREGWKNWKAAMTAAGLDGRILHGAEKEGDENLEVLEWESGDKRKRVRWERVMHGGHNRVATSEQAKLAVLRILESERVQ